MTLKSLISNIQTIFSILSSLAKISFYHILFKIIDLFRQSDSYLKIPQGRLRGKRIEHGRGRTYFSFKGIPYADRPQRFKNPLPHRGWSGTWDAREHRSVSVQQHVFSFPFPSRKTVDGSEDCLFINVYTPSVVGHRAVMFFLHPGMFNMMSGDTLFYGPEYLLTEDVVVVTFNYRLGLLGFFSTGDQHAQGNYGLKDVVMALKWLQANIEYFGGDPGRVMVFGVSSAAAMVHLLLLSPMAKGLFSCAAIQSGSILCPWAFEDDPKGKARETADRMKINASSTEAIVNALMEIKDLKEIVQAQDNLFELPPPRALQPLQFVPVVEPTKESIDERFLVEDPIRAMLSGHYSNIVPLIIGGTSEESLFVIRELMIDPDSFNRFNQNPHLLIPSSWKNRLNSQQCDEVSELIRSFYFSKGILHESEEGQYEYSQYASDVQFLYPIDKTVQMMAVNYKAPIFYYNFSFSGALNNNKRFMFLENFPGATHGDELAYLFKPTFNLTRDIPSTDPAWEVQKRVLQMWTNFAKTGNPTPETGAWQPYDLKEQRYLSIGREMEMKSLLLSDRMNFWRRLEDQYLSE